MEITKSNRPKVSSVRVIARFRPLISIELESLEFDSKPIRYLNSETVSIPRMLDDYESFVFDRVFPPSSTQSEIFDFIGKPIIEDFLKGYNGTVFAYGQTGSGKTFTMMGLNPSNPVDQGLIPKATNLIFEHLSNTSADIEFTIKCSMLEIYKESLKDLLSGSTGLKIKQDKRKGIWIEGLTEICVVNEEETMELLLHGERNRTVASTKMNSVSSRSHQIFMVELIQKFPDDTEKRGTLNLIDLAGCEKISQSGVTGNKLEEAKKINLSLSCLGNVIKALIEKSEHIPYRDSKLTRILQESLGGNYKTNLIVNCSPHPKNLEETLNTLKFAQRAKNIKNKVVVNIKKSADSYLKIIEELQKKLENAFKEIEILKNHGENDITKNLTETSPKLNEDSVVFRMASIGKNEESGCIEALQENINLLMQDKEYFEKKIKDLEKELDSEKKKRFKSEKENFERTLKMNESIEKVYKTVKCEVFYKEENDSLKKQIKILEFHLKNLNTQYACNLEKLKNGESISEWEFIDMSQFASDKNSNLPIYTEEDSLEIVNTSEFAIDVPISDSLLLTTDKYAQGLCTSIENPNAVNKELRIYELKKQFVQSGLINCELSRAYYEILWKYKLLREKMNLRSKLIKSQQERIKSLGEIANSLQIAFTKLVEIHEKFENSCEKNEISGKSKIIRPIKPSHHTIFNQGYPQNRKNCRIGTAFPLKSSNANQNALESYEGLSKYLYIESTLQMQILYNSELKKSNEILMIERNTYKNMLNRVNNENSEVYSREKNKWREFFDEFKAMSEKELVRKQLEINRLNELLGKWMERYLEIEEYMHGKLNTKFIEKKHRETIEMLVRESKIETRPLKLNIDNSPFHSRFKSSTFTQVSNIFGDINPADLDFEFE